MGKRKDPSKVADGLARGLSKREAVRQAGYSAMTAEKKAYAIVKHPLVQSGLTEALERLGMTFDRILDPVIKALDATVIVRTQAGPIATKLPDHRIRLEAHARLVDLYGGTPRSSDIPPLPPRGMIVIINRDGGSGSPAPVDVTPRGKIEARGAGKNPPLPVRIAKGGDL